MTFAAAVAVTLFVRGPRSNIGRRDVRRRRQGGQQGGNPGVGAAGAK